MSELLIRRNTVLAALHAGRRQIIKLWIQEDVNYKTIKPIIKAASARQVAITRVKKQEISQMAGNSRHQGVLLEVGPFVYSELNDIFARAAEQDEKAFLLILDLLHGPQNIGSLLRTAEICGVHGIIIQARRAPDITPSVVQYSAGAAEYLLIKQAANLSQTIEKLQDNGIWVVGLDPEEGAENLGSIDLDLPIALVVGHEGSGLRRLIKRRCDFLLRLPMRGHTESLNAAVSGSVALFAAWQARGFAGTSPGPNG